MKNIEIILVVNLNHLETVLPKKYLFLTKIIRQLKLKIKIWLLYLPFTCTSFTLGHCLPMHIGVFITQGLSPWKPAVPDLAEGANKRATCMLLSVFYNILSRLPKCVVLNL